MSTRFTEVHISSPVPRMRLRAKDHLEGTKVAVSPSLCAPQERPVRQRSGLAVIEEWTLRPPPVCPDRDGRCLYAKSGNRLRSLQPRGLSTRQSWRLLDGLLPLRRRASASAGHRDVFSVPVPNNARDAECSPHARSDRFRTSREMQSGLLTPLLPLRAVGVAALPWEYIFSMSGPLSKFWRGPRVGVSLADSKIAKRQ